MRKYKWIALLCVLAAVGTTPGWWVKGHKSIAEAAAAGLPMDMPRFFRTGGKYIAHYSGDPDFWKNRGTKCLTAAVACEHFLDLEDLKGHPLPEDRWKYVRLIADQRLDPAEKIGVLPYAIMENYERLCCAFKDYRESEKPENQTPEFKKEAIRWKCLHHAGVLAHYTGDTAMPLHTTRNYDGRRQDGGKVLQKGIHAKIDGFPEKFGLSPELIFRDIGAPVAAENVWDYVWKTLLESHTHVERCYELDAMGAFDKKPTEASRAFTLERCRAGARFTMTLWYTAWIKSKDLSEPFPGAWAANSD